MLEKKQFLLRLLRLSEAMLDAVNRDDLDIAAELYGERERFLADHEPSAEPAPEGLIDQVLAADQKVVEAATLKRQKMAESGAQLKGVRDYHVTLRKPLNRGNWGSG